FVTLYLVLVSLLCVFHLYRALLVLLSFPTRRSSDLEGTISPLARLQERGRGVRWGAAHNTFIQVGAELGVPGLLLFIGLIATAFRSLRRVTRLAGRSGPAGTDLSRLAQALTAALIGFVTGSFFLSLAYHDILYTLLAFTLALAKIAHHADTPGGSRSRRVSISVV